MAKKGRPKREKRDRKGHADREAGQADIWGSLEGIAAVCDVGCKTNSQGYSRRG